MSHMAAVDLHVKNLQDLQQACEMLGLQLNLNQTNWRWFNSWVDDYNREDAAYKAAMIKPEEYGKCAEHVITIPGNNECYEIGVVRRRDGLPGWVLVYDFWGNKGRMMAEKIEGIVNRPKLNPQGQPILVNGKPVMEEVHDRAGKLKQYYGLAATARSFKEQGHDIRFVEKSNGHVQCIGIPRNTLKA